MGTAAKAPPRPYKNLWERIKANVREQPAPSWAAELGVKGPCLIWQGTKNSRGYGTISMRRPGRRWAIPRLVHRVVIQFFTGMEWCEIPVGAHLCGTKDCCQPLHLEPTSQSANRIYYEVVEKPAREMAQAA